MRKSRKNTTPPSPKFKITTDKRTHDLGKVIVTIICKNGERFTETHTGTFKNVNRCANLQTGEITDKKEIDNEIVNISQLEPVTIENVLKKYEKNYYIFKKPLFVGTTCMPISSVLIRASEVKTIAAEYVVNKQIIEEYYLEKLID